MMDEFMGFFAIAAIFIALPWLVFHYITKWKSQATLTQPDEKLLEDLHDAARRLDDRLCTIERIMSAEDPDWRRKCALPEQNRDQALLDRADDLLAEHQELLARRRERG
ncbi:envelope stress response membrane protein PspB [Sphingomicrobium sp. XHP0235]|uniref:envelope stress response membrane protein PspB n=1 Tax=Sphingomicrobium aquimarinum TaxID=3133971 RepID=UPI0031FE8E46